MPRRPASSGGPARKRTRTGCLACRQRKVKCDEATPRCSSCVSRNLVCHRHVQLKWEPEFTARGLTFGREGVWSRRAEKKQPDLQKWRPSRPWFAPVRSRDFINNVYADFAHAYDMESHDDEASGQLTVLSTDRKHLITPTPALIDSWSSAPAEPPWSLWSATGLWSVTPRSPSVSTPVSLFPDLGEVHYDLLQYYLLQICPATTPSRAKTSPFASLVGPLFAQGGQEYALMAVLALAARHRSLKDSRYTATALTLKGRVLRGLRDRIGSHDTEASEVLLDTQILASMMFLCLYEIVDNCDHRWVIHLRASQNFLRLGRKHRRHGAGNDSLYAFVERFFLFQDAISRTACGEQSLFDFEYWQTLPLSDAAEWSSCTPALSGLLFRITDLSRRREDLTSDVFESQADNLMEELMSIDDGLKGSDPLMERSIRLQKASAELYHYCLLRDASPSTPVAAKLVPLIIREVSHLINEGCVADLIFPLFTAAVELDPLHDEDVAFTGEGTTTSGRKAVLDILDSIAGKALANTQRIDDTIRKVWKMRDLAQHERDDVMGVCGRKNDWNIYVSPYCVNISLA